MAADRIEAPWTMEQVAALNRYQTGEGWPWRMHPFTCGQREGHPVVGGDAGILVATRLGWLCPYCTYTQRWAHTFMAQPAPVLTDDERAALEALYGAVHD